MNQIQYKLSVLPLFEEDLYTAIDLMVCVNKRVSFGGTAKENVEEQIKYIESITKEN